MKYTDRKDALLLLEDGSSFRGKSIGKEGTSGGEICFNTGMTGYQEVYTDPSYYGQVIVNTTPHIGNYGINKDEQESEKPKIFGLIVNEFSEYFSRKTADDSLDQYLKTNGIVGITNLDTRKIVRHIRSRGAMNCIISSEILDEEKLFQKLKEIPSMEGLELSSQISQHDPFLIGDESNSTKIAVLDLGIKTSILKNFNERGCVCKVYPAKTSFEEMEQWNPDGYFISNGPGDPGVMDYAVENVKKAQESMKPVFGICLGHQLLARANNISTYKMHHGHRGLNHPVKNIETGRGEITSQNHGFAVSSDTIRSNENITVTHINLNDDTIEGLKVNNRKAFSVQYHPESSPGPHDSRYLFDNFLTLIKTK